jgi:hypothetical protein
MRLKPLSRATSAQILLIALAVLAIMPDPYDLTSYRGLTLLWSNSPAPNPSEDINDAPDQVCTLVHQRLHSDLRTSGGDSPSFRLTPTAPHLAVLEMHKARLACRQKIAKVEDLLHSLCQLTC